MADKKILSYPMKLIRTGLYLLEFTRLKPKTYRLNDDSRRALILYCLCPINGKYLPLGRDYKPLGIHKADGEWEDYHEYPFLLIDKEQINFDYLKKVSTQYESEKEGGFIFIFNDVTNPYRDKKSAKRYEEIIKNMFIIT